MDLAIVQTLITGILALFPGLPSGISVFVANLVSQIPALVAAGTDMAQFLNSQLALIKQMVDENRDPTEAEWNSLNQTVATELAKLTASAGMSAPTIS